MAKSSNKKENRIVFIDNIRLYLTILVILHHIAIAYGGSGILPIRETPTDSMGPIIFFVFNIINQSYFMSFFFMLSGYFVPIAFDKKGAYKFLVERFIRLGIPLLVYAFFLAPFIDYLILNFVRGNSVSFLSVMISLLQGPKWDIGPLWFIEGLIILCLIYTFFRIITKFSLTPFKNNFPGTVSIIIIILIFSIGTFIMRLKFPIGQTFHVFQLAYSFHYILCFFLGVLASRGNWLNNLTRQIAKIWKITAFLNILALLVVFGFLGGDNLRMFFGGFTWQSFLTSTWESIACISIIISLIDVFQNRFNKQGKILQWMSPNFYIVYIIHIPVILGAMVPLLQYEIATPFKFIIVSLFTIPFCFVSGNLMRKIPLAKRVLG